MHSSQLFALAAPVYGAILPTDSSDASESELSVVFGDDFGGSFAHVELILLVILMIYLIKIMLNALM